MAGRGRSNPLALAVLALLFERPMHPYEMSSMLRHRRKEDSIKLNFGSLYAVVESLHKRGLIAAQETVRAGRRPERTVYSITDAGVAELVDWLSDLVARPAKEFTQFQAALSLLGVLPPDDAIRLLQTRLLALEDRYRTYQGLMNEARESGFPRIFMIEHEYEMSLLAAEVAYVRTLTGELTAGTLSGVDGWRRLHELRTAGATPDEIEAELAKEFGFPFEKPP